MKPTPALLARIVLLTVVGASLLWEPLQLTYAAKPITLEMQLRHDRKYRDFVEERLRRYIANNDRRDAVSARRTVKQAEQYLNRISSDFMTSGERLVLRKELEDLKRHVDAMGADASDRRERAFAVMREKSDFGAIVHEYTAIYHMLNAGRQTSEGRYSFTIDDLDTLRHSVAGFIAFEAEFRQRFARLIEDEPGYTVRGIEVATFLDLLQHAKAYQGGFTELIAAKTIAARIDHIQRIAEKLDTEGLISQYWLKDLYGGEISNDYYDIDIKLRPYFEAASRKPPRSLLEKLALYRHELKVKIESAAQANSWNGDDYPVRNDAMKTAIERFIRGRDWALVEFGGKPHATLNKSAKDIPLYKSYQGMIVLRLQDEPFDRAYRVQFISHFDGDQHPDVSEVQVPHELTPFQR